MCMAVVGVGRVVPLGAWGRGEWGGQIPMCVAVVGVKRASWVGSVRVGEPRGKCPLGSWRELARGTTVVATVAGEQVSWQQHTPSRALSYPTTTATG